MQSVPSTDFELETLYMCWRHTEYVLEEFLPEINLGQNCLNFWKFFGYSLVRIASLCNQLLPQFLMDQLNILYKNLTNILKINITNIIPIKFILGKFMVVSSGKFLFIHQYE